MPLSYCRRRFMFFLGILALFAVAVPGVARAGTAFQLEMANETPEALHITMSADQCTLLDGNVKSGASVNLARHQTWTLNFSLRKARCTINNSGSLTIYVYSASQPRVGSELAITDIAFTDEYGIHTKDRMKTNVQLRLQHIPNAYGAGKNLINVVFHDTAATDAAQAVQLGCASPSRLAFELAMLARNPNIGEATRNMVSEYTPANYATIGRVARGRWVYRAAPILKEVESLMVGRTLSPASRKEKDKPDYWKIHGPKLSGPDDPLVLAMRLLALSSSSRPDSQFNSVALSPKVAASFSTQRYVYAFWMVPWSEVLGISECALSGGEIQLQPFGGTRVFDLHRWSGKPGARWEKYNYPTKQWKAVDYVPGAGS